MVGQQEEVGEIDAAPSVEVEAGVAAAEGVRKEDEAAAAGFADAVEVRGNFRGGGEGHRVETGHGRRDGVDSGQALGEGGGSAAVLIGVWPWWPRGVPPPMVTAKVTVAPSNRAWWCVSLKWGVSRSVL